jgi:protein TonB
MVSPNAVAQPPAWRRHALRALIVLVAGGLIVALALWLQTLSGVPSAPKRQVARIALLPDQPPPPPPPPKDEPPPPPREAPKQPLREEQVKEAEAPKPANEPIKMEGEAGSGPSAFAAGPVRSEYSGGAPQIGPAASAAAVRDRARERLYVNSRAADAARRAWSATSGARSTRPAPSSSLWLQRDGSIEPGARWPAVGRRLGSTANCRPRWTSTARQELRLPPPPAPAGRRRAAALPTDREADRQG